jgi:hypothetical protein
MLIVPCKRWSGSNQHLAQNKKNVLPYGLDPRKKQCKLNKCITIMERGKWMNKTLKKVMDAIESGRTSLRQTNKFVTFCHIT